MSEHLITRHLITTSLEERITFWHAMVAKRADAGNIEGTQTCQGYLDASIDMLCDFERTKDVDTALAQMDAQTEAMNLESALLQS